MSIVQIMYTFLSRYNRSSKELMIKAHKTMFTYITPAHAHHSTDKIVEI